MPLDLYKGRNAPGNQVKGTDFAP